MTIARSRQVCLAATPYYHCISRCVRRAFLCGKDVVTRKSYEHRRQWVENRLFQLSDVFAIDVCAYAVMSNHVHLVLFVDEETANSWSMDEVLKRWHQLFKGTLLTQKYLRGEELLAPMIDIVRQTAEQYRKRLMDISWLMRLLNESIARQANREDNCKGRFWEGRFSSQALLDEKALAACMAYVDLNPIRANIAKTPETSDFTSIKLRIKAAIQGKQPEKLPPFVGNPSKGSPAGLPFCLTDYLELVELTGRCIREDKKGYIAQHQPKLLTRLNISAGNWVTLSQQFSRCFRGAVGDVDSLTKYCQHQHRKRRSNLANCEKLLA
ncbi:transposase [Thalassotalea hakodatensis]|uniref:transposase n=1 Tax=Thalassotalea hakodatensis TaxID=3030492 RepID=UPI002573C448|nr:transposase [Thalassotalea hakodatensis]